MEDNPKVYNYIQSIVTDGFVITDDAINSIIRLFTDIITKLYSPNTIDDIYRLNNMTFPNEFGIKIADLLQKTVRNSPLGLSQDELVDKILFTQMNFIISSCIEGAIQSCKSWYSSRITSYDIYMSVCNNINLKNIVSEKIDCSIFDTDGIRYKEGVYCRDVLEVNIQPNNIERGCEVIMYNMEKKYREYMEDKISKLRKEGKLTVDLEETYKISINNFTTNFLNSYMNSDFTDVTIYGIFKSYTNIDDPNVKEFISKILYGFS